MLELLLRHRSMARPSAMVESSPSIRRYRALGFRLARCRVATLSVPCARPRPYTAHWRRSGRAAHTAASHSDRHRERQSHDR